MSLPLFHRFLFVCLSHLRLFFLFAHILHKFKYIQNLMDSDLCLSVL